MPTDFTQFGDMTGTLGGLTSAQLATLYGRVVAQNEAQTQNNIGSLARQFGGNVANPVYLALAQNAQGAGAARSAGALADIKIQEAQRQAQNELARRGAATNWLQALTSKAGQESSARLGQQQLEASKAQDVWQRGITERQQQMQWLQALASNPQLKAMFTSKPGMGGGGWGALGQPTNPGIVAQSPWAVSPATWELGKWDNWGSQGGFAGVGGGANPGTNIGGNLGGSLRSNSYWGF